jgi:hypothetical protein
MRKQGFQLLEKDKNPQGFAGEADAGAWAFFV